jgi:hypothetical protein
LKLFQVLKYGNALGRSVDLMHFKGYDELISELDQIFDFKGSLINGSSGWLVTFTDHEGDMMLIGDYPWQLRTKTHVTVSENVFDGVMTRLIWCIHAGTFASWYERC